jgi:N-acetylglucosamine kinase-like BadF-type ATPase
MILIADSGSTKTEWRLTDNDGKTTYFFTAGINPLFQSTSDVSEILRKEVINFSQISNLISHIYFYGASCSSPERSRIVEDGIRTCFPHADIEVQHDLLGAARALCGSEAGIAGILGTGSNSCYYDGQEIRENIPALGYVLGDEAGGAWFGKELVRAFLYREMPSEIEKKFTGKYGLTKEKIFEAVYRQPLPNRFLATLAPFLSENKEHEFIRNLVQAGFHEYFSRHVVKYSRHRELPFNSVGSVGFYLKDILSAVAAERGIRTGKIIQSPAEGLVWFHSR